MNRLARVLAVLLALSVMATVISCVQRKNEPQPFVGSSKSLGPP